MAKVAGRKKRIIGTTVALVAIGGGAAFAYWTATGTGSADTTAGESKNFTITSKITGEPLSPGGPEQLVSFTVTNPGTGIQTASKVDVRVANSDGTTWTSEKGCTAGDFAVGTPNFTATSIEPSEAATGTVTLRMVNLNENQDRCQGATVPLYFSAS
ncbi:hypothetical protein [Pseudarthrobacter oxydans]|uniref:hypothetical protein n=1 Tax=Pseudarthrobacter oxydans TaxID=1671 RepID=UPI0034291F98